jgi:hypothetical protein
MNIPSCDIHWEEIIYADPPVALAGSRSWIPAAAAVCGGIASAC